MEDGVVILRLCFMVAEPKSHASVLITEPAQGTKRLTVGADVLNAAKVRVILASGRLKHTRHF
jgi:hypothetical protein